MSENQNITTIQGFLDFVYSSYSSMKTNEVNLIYEGEITHQVTKAFVALTEANMKKGEDSGNVQRKVFHVMIECLQSINKYSGLVNENSKKVGRGILLVNKSSSKYNITTGNIVTNKSKDELTTLLDKINSLDKEDLDEFYQEQISNPKNSDAGSGFIDIAKKTGEKFNYNFLPLNENESYFILVSSISRK